MMHHIVAGTIFALFAFSSTRAESVCETKQITCELETPQSPEAACVCRTSSGAIAGKVKQKESSGDTANSALDDERPRGLDPDAQNDLVKRFRQCCN